MAENQTTMEVALFNNLDMYLELHKLIKAYNAVYGTGAQYVGADKVKDGEVRITSDEFIELVQNKHIEFGYSGEPSSEELIKALQNSTKLSGKRDWGESLRFLADNPDVLKASYRKFKEQDTENVKTSQENVETAEKTLKDNKKENAKHKRRRFGGILGKIATATLTGAVAGGYLFGAFSLAGGLAGLASISTMPFATLAVVGGVIIYRVGKSVVGKIWKNLNKVIDKANAVIKNDASVLGSNKSLKNAKKLAKQNLKAYNLINSKHHAYSSQNEKAFYELEGLLNGEVKKTESQTIGLGPASVPQNSLGEHAYTQAGQWQQGQNIVEVTERQSENSEGSVSKAENQYANEGTPAPIVLDGEQASVVFETGNKGATQTRKRKSSASKVTSEATAEQVNTSDIYALHNQIEDKGDLTKALTEIIYQVTGHADPDEIKEDAILKHKIAESIENDLNNVIYQYVEDTKSTVISPIRYQREDERDALAQQIFKKAKQQLQNQAKGEALPQIVPNSPEDALAQKMADKVLDSYAKDDMVVGVSVSKNGAPIPTSWLSGEQQALDQAITQTAERMVELFSGNKAPTNAQLTNALKYTTKDGKDVVVTDISKKSAEIGDKYKDYLAERVEWEPVFNNQRKLEQAFVSINENNGGTIKTDAGFGLGDLELDAYQAALVTAADICVARDDSINPEDKAKAAEEIIKYFTSTDALGKAPTLPGKDTIYTMQAAIEVAVEAKRAQSQSPESEVKENQETAEVEPKPSVIDKVKGKVKEVFTPKPKVEKISKEDIAKVLEENELTPEQLEMLVEHPALNERIKAKAKADGSTLGAAFAEAERQTKEIEAGLEK